MSRVWSPLWWIAALALLAGPRSVWAQASSQASTPASATAGATAQIVEPIGILNAAPGSTADAPAGRTAGMAQLSGGVFSIQGPANQVVSVSVSLPASVERIGGGQPLPISARRANASRILTAAGAAAFEVAGAAPVQGAPGGVYAGMAQVLINLN